MEQQPTYAQIEATRRRLTAAGRTVARANIDIIELNPDDPLGEPCWCIDGNPLISTRELIAHNGNQQPAHPLPPLIRLRPAAPVAPPHDIRPLPLTAIRRDGGTQPRAALDNETLAEYAEAMAAGARFPAVEVFYDGHDYWLVDGFHRVNAALTAGRTQINATVIAGTQREAILYSAGVNARHGLRRTNADKRRTVERILRDPEWVKWSDREIAQRCAVSHTFVSRVRSDLTGNVASENSDERTYITKSGAVATMNTAAIGQAVQSEQIGRTPATSAISYAPIWELEAALHRWAHRTYPDRAELRVVLGSLKELKDNSSFWAAMFSAVGLPHHRSDLLQAINNVCHQVERQGEGPQPVRITPAPVAPTADVQSITDLADNIAPERLAQLISAVKNWLHFSFTYSGGNPIQLLQGIIARSTPAQIRDFGALSASRFIPQSTATERLLAVQAVFQELQTAAPALVSDLQSPIPDLRPATDVEVSMMISHMQETADIFSMDRAWLTDYAADVGKRQGLLVTPDQVAQELEDLLVEAQFAQSRPIAALISQGLKDLQTEVHLAHSRPITQSPVSGLQSPVSDIQFPHTIGPVTIHCADARAAVTTVTTPVHLVITSPPYNTGGVIAYDGHADDLDQDAYDNLLEDVWRRCAEVLAPGGRLCINVPFGMGRSPWTPVTPAIYRQLAAAGLTIEGQIVWDKGTSGNSTAWGSWGRPSNPVLRDTCEAIIIAAKSGESAMPRDILVQAGPAQLISPWLREEGVFMQLTQDHWQIAPESATRVGHPAPFPVKLAENLVRLYGWPGCHILDPFAGSGTTALAVVGLPGGDRCQVTLIEQSPAYCQLAATRLAQRLA